MRKSSVLFLIIAAEAFALGLLAIHGASRRAADVPALAEKRTLARAEGLTDLCLFTEARYTRHPALADLHAAFQDAPLSFDHFPAGSIVAPPFARGGN